MPIKMPQGSLEGGRTKTSECFASLELPEQERSTRRRVALGNLGMMMQQTLWKQHFKQVMA
jgi:hypothetical protein